MCDICKVEAIVRMKLYPKFARNSLVTRLKKDDQFGYSFGFSTQPQAFFSSYGSTIDEAIARFEIDLDRFIKLLKQSNLWAEPGDDNYE